MGWTKTILQSGGIVKALSARASERLIEWIRAVGLADEPDAVLFCSVYRSNKVYGVPTVPMSAPSLKDIWHRASRHAGQTSHPETYKGHYASWIGHILRVGAAQDMARKGVFIAQIMFAESDW